MRTLLFGLALVGSVGGVAIADGWKYGGNNCGCMVSCTQTTAQCIACCEAAVIPTGPLTPGQVTKCIAFCNQMAQPCGGCP